jgi:outer membrane receptor for ferric coprogen and ferric-rhodotorulic acid
MQKAAAEVQAEAMTTTLAEAQAGVMMTTPAEAEVAEVAEAAQAGAMTTTPAAAGTDYTKTQTATKTKLPLGQGFQALPQSVDKVPAYQLGFCHFKELQRSIKSR